MIAIMSVTDATSLTDAQFSALLQADAVRTVELIPTNGGDRWEVRINGTLYLRSQREPRRRFASLDTALRYLRDRGVTTATVDLAAWRSKADK